MTVPLRDGLLQNAFNANNQKVTSLAAPTDALDAANKQYVDSFGAGLSWHAPVNAASVGNVNIAAPGAAIDGYAFVAPGERVLLKNQTIGTENGLWDWQGAAVPLTRSADGTTGNLNAGALVAVINGTVNANTVWVLVTADPITIGVTALLFIPFVAASLPGNGLVAVGTTLHFAQSAAYTAGQIPFASGVAAMGFDADLVWDNVNKRLAVGFTAPFHAFEVDTGADRPAIRFGNTTSNEGGFLYSNASSQARLIGGADWNGVDWIGRSANGSSAVECLAGEINFYVSQALVVGNAFTPVSAGRFFLQLGTPCFEFSPSTGPFAAFGGVITSATLHLYDNSVGPALRFEGQASPGVVDGGLFYQTTRGGLIACTNSDERFLTGTWWIIKHSEIDRSVSATEPARTNLITDSGAGSLVMNGAPLEDMSIRFKTVVEMDFAGGADKYFQFRLTFGGVTTSLIILDPTTFMVDGVSYRVELDFVLTIGLINAANGEYKARGRVTVYDTFNLTFGAVQAIDATIITADTATAGQDVDLEFSWTNAIGAGVRVATQEEGLVEFLY